MSKRHAFMTTELMVVAVVLAILSGIATSAVPSFASRAKRAALASSLAVLQGASDRYFIESNLYPCGVLPEPGTSASEMDLGAVDALGQKFIGQYLHTAPNNKALDYGLSASNGTKVYFGVTASGHVFATQVQSVAGKWSSASMVVFVQEDVQGTVSLGDVW